MSQICRALVISLSFGVVGFLLEGCSEGTPNVPEPIEHLQPTYVSVCELEEDPDRFNDQLVSFEAEAHLLDSGVVELWSLKDCSYERRRTERTEVPRIDAGKVAEVNLFLLLDNGRKVMNVHVTGVANSIVANRRTIFGPQSFKHSNIQPFMVRQISELRDGITPVFPPPVQ